MPYIITRTTKKIAPHQLETIKQKLGKAIEIFPGKTEDWLMVDFDDECKIFFKGNNDADSAYVEVKIFGTAAGKYFDMMTEAVCEILNEVLSIPKERIYVKYEEVSNWGWNSANF